MFKSSAASLFFNISKSQNPTNQKFSFLLLILHANAPHNNTLLFIDREYHYLLASDVVTSSTITKQTTHTRPYRMTEENQESFTLPKNFPLAAENRVQLKDSRPPAKASYMDKYIHPYLSDIRQFITDAIDTKIEIAAQIYYSAEMSDEEYAKAKDEIYETFSKDQDWASGIDDAFNEYSNANDAYSLMVHVALEVPQQRISIESLFDHVSREQNAIANGLPLPVPSLTEVYDQKLSHLKKQNHAQTAAADAIRNINQIIFVSVYPERPMPFNLESENPTGNNDGDDDVEVDGGKVDLTCPISRQLFTKPVKSIICKHTYDSASLQTYLRSSHECPECGSHLQISDTVVDTIMQTRVECFKRDRKLENLIKSRRPDDTDKL